MVRARSRSDGVREAHPQSGHSALKRGSGRTTARDRTSWASLKSICIGTARNALERFTGRTRLPDIVEGRKREEQVQAIAEDPRRAGASPPRGYQRAVVEPRAVDE